MKRITVSLDDEVYQALQEWADDEERSMSSLLSYLAKLGVRKRQQDQQQQPKAS